MSNTVTLTLPPLPDGATEWKVYRGSAYPPTPYEREMKSRKWWRRRNKALWREQERVRQRRETWRHGMYYYRVETITEPQG